MIFNSLLKKWNVGLVQSITLNPDDQPLSIRAQISAKFEHLSPLVSSFWYLYREANGAGRPTMLRVVSRGKYLAIEDIRVWVSIFYITPTWIGNKGYLTMATIKQLGNYPLAYSSVLILDMTYWPWSVYPTQAMMKTAMISIFNSLMLRLRSSRKQSLQPQNLLPIVWALRQPRYPHHRCFNQKIVIVVRLIFPYVLTFHYINARFWNRRYRWHEWLSNQEISPEII